MLTREGHAKLEDRDSVLKIDPNFALAYFGKGFEKKGLGDYEGAIADLEKAISLAQVLKSQLQPFIDKTRKKDVR